MTKKASKKGKKRARVTKKVTMSGKRHLEELLEIHTGEFPLQAYDILSAIRGPDFRDSSDLKDQFTGVIRTWIFGAGLVGGLVQSKEAPVTTKGWRVLKDQAKTASGQDTRGDEDHFLLHIIQACEVIGGLYETGAFKEGK